MVVPKGFKETELGCIPMEWQITPLEQISDVRTGPFGTVLHASDYVLLGTPIITVEHLGDRGITRNNLPRVSDLDRKRLSKYTLNVGDIVFSRVGSIDRNAYVTEDEEGWLFSGRLLRIRPFPNGISHKYLSYYFKQRKTISRIEAISVGQTMASLNTQLMNQFQVVVPTLTEQNAIATALSDVDELIDSLENLIEKKKAIKQGAMQELLTGRKRLPGFKGEWTEKPLGELFNFYGGVSASRDMLSTTGYCYLHYGDIHSAHKPYIDTTKDYSLIPKFEIDLRKVSNNSHLNDGDVVFVDASEDDEGASRHIVVRNPKNIPFISGLHTIVAKEKHNDLVHLYREYCFQTKQIKDQFKYFAAGTKVTGISKANIAKIVLRFPVDRLEQQSIGNVLSDMDNEIEALTQNLEKSRQIKQGMMQELLTGHIRLLQTATQKQKKAKAPKLEMAPKNHNEHFHEAVILSTVVSLFASEQFPLGRFRRQKFAYLLHRHAQESTQGFLKKAAGPYNPTIRYKDEKIALTAGYVAELGKGKFVQGEKSSEAVAYFVQWYSEDAIEWIKQFQYRKNDDLEVLTTVAEAIVDLKKSDLAITVESVKQIIRENPEWRPKLDKDCFSDFKIQFAIKESQKLFG